MKKVLILMLAMVAGNASGAAFEREVETKTFSDKLMNLFVREKFDEGLDLSKAYWPLPAVEIDSLANTIDQQWAIVRQRFGKSIGMEHIKTERIGKSFVRHVYLHKFANHAIYWRIEYYKPTDKWLVNSIVFLDQFNGLYE